MKKLVIFSTVISIFLLQTCDSPKSQEFEIDEQYLSELDSFFNVVNQNRKNYLSITALHKLDTGSNSFGKDSTNDLVLKSNIPSHLGTIYKFQDSLVFEPSDLITFYMQSDSAEVTQTSLIALDENGWSDTFHHENISFRILTRNNSLYLRVLDPNNPAIEAFKGFESFEISSAFIFKGNFTYYDEPEKFEVPSIMGGTETTTFLGKASFNYQGESFSFDVGENGFVMLQDQTAGKETYGGGRYFYLDVPEADGEIIIDFNRMYNPPCAFSKYTVCLFAPKQNHFPFEIRAGEKYTGDY